MHSLARAEQGDAADDAHGSTKLDASDKKRGAKAAMTLEQELRLDEYDDDAEIDADEDDSGWVDDDGSDEEDSAMADSAAAGNLGGMQGEGMDDDADDDAKSEGSDAEDNAILSSDAVLLVAHTEEDFSCIEVQIYDEENGSLYVHHDITLPAFPLALEWLSKPPSLSSSSADATADVAGTAGSFVAVGTFKPGIELWNLDVLDPLEPSAVLGGEAISGASGAGAGVGKARGKGGRSRVSLVEGSHTDAVMGLSWNVHNRDVLASGSADTTVKLWDIGSQRCTGTWQVHTGKVQDILWHPQEAALLASGSFDKTAAVFDVRAAPQSVECARYQIPADVECIGWNPFAVEQLVVASEDGVLSCFDVRSRTSPLWTLNAHSKTTSSLCFSPHVPGLLVTASVDKSVKVWDVLSGSAHSGGSPGPTLVAEKAMAVGQLFTAQFDADSPFLLATGGAKGVVALWEMTENRAVADRFAGRESVAEAAPAPMTLAVAPRETPPPPPPATGAVPAPLTAATPPPPAAADLKPKSQKQKKPKKKSK